MATTLARALAEIPPGATTSRAAVAARTGLTKATASTLVAELIALGLVEEVPATPGARTTGRPAVPLRRRGGTVVGMGIEISAAGLSVRLADLAGGTVAGDDVAIPRTSSPTRPLDPAATVAVVAGTIATTVRRLRRAGTIVAGVGVVAPGLVRPDLGEVIVAPPLGWRDVPLRASLESARSGRRGAFPPIRVHNEADAAGIAEHRFGAIPPDVRTALYVSAGDGVGAALVVDGTVFTGSHGFGGELGHFVVEPDGRRCACGKRGCLETVVTAAALRSTRGLERAERGLCAAVSTAVDLLDPEVIVLGGHLSELLARLAPSLRTAIRSRALAAAWVDYPVIAAAIGGDAAALGAADLALDPVRQDPRSVA